LVFEKLTIFHVSRLKTWLWQPITDNNAKLVIWYRIRGWRVSAKSRIYIYQNIKIKLIMAKKLSITPLHDRVIVKAAAAEEKSAGGIIIPDTAKEKPQRGTVVAAGPGKKDEPVTVKAGDTVLYGKYAGTEISIEGVEYLIMRESDILAIV
jgi:chaperonin GroES